MRPVRDAMTRMRSSLSCLSTRPSMASRRIHAHLLASLATAKARSTCVVMPIKRHVQPPMFFLELKRAPLAPIRPVTQRHKMTPVFPAIEGRHVCTGREAHTSAATWPASRATKSTPHTIRRVREKRRQKFASLATRSSAPSHIAPRPIRCRPGRWFARIAIIRTVPAARSCCTKIP